MYRLFGVKWWVPRPRVKMRWATSPRWRGHGACTDRMASHPASFKFRISLRRCMAPVMNMRHSDARLCGTHAIFRRACSASCTRSDAKKTQCVCFQRHAQNFGGACAKLHHRMRGLIRINVEFFGQNTRVSVDIRYHSCREQDVRMIDSKPVGRKPIAATLRYGWSAIVI